MAEKCIVIDPKNRHNFIISYGAMNLGLVFAFFIVSLTVAFLLQNPEQNRVHAFAWTFEGSLDSPDTWPVLGCPRRENQI